MTSFDSEEEPLFEDVKNLYIAYAVCHLTSMTSAISNPILYGFLNENFREEFYKILRKLKSSSNDQNLNDCQEIGMIKIKQGNPV